MNPENQIPPAIPAIPPTMPASPETLDEQQPITSLTGVIEALMRQPRRVLWQLRQPGAGRTIVWMLAAAFIASLVYGAVMGSFSMGSQLWVAPIKLSLGLFLAALICLPSLYIFSCLAGSRARLIEVTGMVAGLLLLTTLLLVGFAPVAWLFSQSSQSVVWMGVLHLMLWFVAAGFGLRFLDQGFAKSQARSKAGLFLWCIIYLLVSLQMSTALRPLVGTSDKLLPENKKFFLVHWGDCISQSVESVPKEPIR